MADKFSGIPDDVLKDAVDNAPAGKSSGGAANSESPPPRRTGGTYDDLRPPKPTGAEKKQHGPFKKTRAGVVLSKDEVKAIKAGRKKLRKEMRSRGIKSKKEFEIVAGSLGLYFDKKRPPAWLLLHWPLALLAALLALLGVLFIFSLVQRMRGLYTVNLSDGMLKEGFVLADNKEFKDAAIQLFATPSKDCPCVSINQIPKDIDENGDEHNKIQNDLDIPKNYFAYTYYIKNEGESTVGYDWALDLNSESQRLSTAAWVIVFYDGKPRIYALANNATGEAEAIPAFGDNTKGYINLPIKDVAGDTDQFELIKEDGLVRYFRVVPDKFENDQCIVSGRQDHVKPQEMHKFTVVLWLEGDDVDATDDKIGGHLGVEMNFRLVDEKAAKKSSKGGTSFIARMRSFFEEIFGTD